MGRRDLPQVSPTPASKAGKFPLATPRQQALTLADVVAKMDQLEAATSVGSDYDLIWLRLRNWVEANA